MPSHPDLVLREGSVPDTIDSPLRAKPHWQIGRDAFRMTLPSGLAFHYRRGQGTVFARGAGVSDDEVALFFDGSVRGAIAWLGGLFPLHASAVVHDGGVYAFTGKSGEGKSTLVAALAKRGFATFCDDVLVVDADALALPGHKRLKLWQDALALTAHVPLRAVRPGMDKFFVEGRPTSDETSLPLRRLYILESVEWMSPEITDVRGSERFTALRAAYYRPLFGTAVWDPLRYFQKTTQLAAMVAVRRFARSRDLSAFGSGVDAIVADLCSEAG